MCLLVTPADVWIADPSESAEKKRSRSFGFFCLRRISFLSCSLFLVGVSAHVTPKSVRSCGVDLAAMMASPLRSTASSKRPLMLTRLFDRFCHLPSLSQLFFLACQLRRFEQDEQTSQRPAHLFAHSAAIIIPHKWSSWNQAIKR